MSRTNNYPFALKVCLCAAVCFLVGCSSGVKRSDKAVSSAQTLKRQCLNLQGQIDKTIQSLDGVVAAKNGDLSTAFKNFKAQMKSLKSQTKKTASSAQKLKKSSEGYLAAWEKRMQEVENPEIRKQAAQRRATASAKFADAKDEIDRIRSDYETFAKNLREIQVALEHDLYPAGVTAIEPVIAQAKVDSAPMKEDISTIIAALDKIIAALSRMPAS